MIEENLTKFRLKDIFVFSGFKFSDSWLVDGQILVKLKRTSQTGKCPDCKKRKRKPIERFTRRIRDLDIGGLICCIEVEVYRISCPADAGTWKNLVFQANTQDTQNALRKRLSCSAKL